MANLNPRLTLVGAGPGDPDLITVKGLKALQSADVILYDALIDKDLLKNAPQAKKIFVGKRKGLKIYSQEAINEMIVEKAYAYGHVVRLKGGDPFIFGRGAEEIAHARRFGVRCDVVPGISSSNAVPASIGISVTLRNVAQSYMVLTGTTSSREFNQDIALAAQTSATLVILMGIGQMEKIVSLYRALGNSNTPIAIIQNGFCKNQKQVVGDMDSILDLIEKEEIGNPAVIVIGEVVKHAQQVNQILADEKLLQIA